MSTFTEKTTDPKDDIHHHEVALAANYPNGSHGAADEDEEYHFTLGKFFAIAVSSTFFFSNRQPRLSPGDTP